MSSASGAISFKQVAQVAAYALAYHTVSPDNFNATICTLAMGEIGCIGIDLADKSRKWVKEAQCFYKMLHQDLQQLLDDAADYQKYLGLEPFLPAHDCQTEIASTLPDKREISSDGLIALPSEILEILFSCMTVEQLARFSAVSKRCYVATKMDSVWQCQLNKLFPKLNYVPRKECGLTSEQQYEIVYRRTQLLLNEFKAMYKDNVRTTDRLYKELKLLSVVQGVGPGHVHKCYYNRLCQLVGDHYVGTDESIDGLSIQGSIITCINELKKDYQAVANPERFEKFIRQATKAVDIQKRLQDFPQRVRKMQTLADQNLFADMFICGTIEINTYDFTPKVLVWTGAVLTIMVETSRLINKGRTKMLLNKMLEYQPSSYSNEPLFHYSKFNKTG